MFIVDLGLTPFLLWEDEKLLAELVKLSWLYRRSLVSQPAGVNDSGILSSPPIIGVIVLCITSLTGGIIDPQKPITSSELCKELSFMYLYPWQRGQRLNYSVAIWDRIDSLD